MIKKLDIKVNLTTGGLFHDSRADARLLGKCVNALIQKVNELIVQNNELKKKIDGNI